MTADDTVDNNNRLSCGWTVNKCWRQNGLTTCILNGAVQTEAVAEWTDWAEIVLLTTWSLVHTNQRCIDRHIQRQVS